MALYMALAAGWWCSRSPLLPRLLYLLELSLGLCSKQLAFLCPQSSSTGYILSALLLLTLPALASLLKLLILLCKNRRRNHGKLTTFDKLADSVGSRALRLAIKPAVNKLSLLL